MTTEEWISTDAALPVTGQTVYVRTKYETVPHVVTFYAHPPRWEHDDLAFQFEFFVYWKPAGPIDPRSGM